MHEAVWKALADPTRRSILKLLRDGPKTTGQLTEEFEELSRFTVMKHMGVLEEAELLEYQRRGRQRWNFLNAAPLLAAMNDWVLKEVVTPDQHEWAVWLNRMKTQAESTVVTDTGLKSIGFHQTFEIGASAEAVFKALTEDVNIWWGQGYRQTGEGSLIEMGSKVGSYMIERNGNGHEVIWGRIEEIEHAKRICLSGRFAVPGALNGLVQFDLETSNGGCQLSLTHQAIGEIEDSYQDGFQSGWMELLYVQLRSHVEES